MPEVSAVRRFLEAGLPVYVLEWTINTSEDALGLTTMRAASSQPSSTLSLPKRDGAR
jgi:hypothetical protein